MSQLRRIFTGGLVVASLLAVFGAPSPALAASPWWHLQSSVLPTPIAPGGEGTIVVQAFNFGDEHTSGAITLSDVLPAGVTVLESEGKPEVSFYASFGGQDLSNFGSFLCKVAEPRVTCTLPEGLPTVKPYENIELHIGVKLGTVSGDNEAEVAGGGAANMRLERPLDIGTATPTFGVERFEQVPEEEGGAVDAQAGSHPFQFTTTFGLDQNADPLNPPALAKDLQFKLPAGLAGNATALPQCGELAFKDIISTQNFCPSDSVVGVAIVTFDEPKEGSVRTWALPIFNLPPAIGEPARFGFTVIKTPVIIDTSVRTGSDYGVTASVRNVSQVINFISESVSFWGVPGDPSHDGSRGWACLNGGAWEALGEQCAAPSQRSTTPFLTLPTSCETPFVAGVEGDSWPTATDPSGLTLPAGSYSLEDSFNRPLGMTGCNQLPFSPTIEVAPDVQDASSASGLKVDVHVPQEVSENPQGLASSSVKSITVALPEGVALNPAGAGGLEACSEALVGYEPSLSNPPSELHFSSRLPGSTAALDAGEEQPLQQGVNFCPNASKIATVKIKTPLLPEPLEGSVYLAAQNENPFGSLVAMYIVAEDPVAGTLVKLPGQVHLTETGQVVANFENSPQLPFEDAELHFFGGERAPLGTPAKCGPHTTHASFGPWSGNAPAQAESTFEVLSGPNGSACPGQNLPFDPSLTAGMTSVQAGGFSPFTMTMSREDGNQELQAISLHMPPGLSGLLSSVKLCGEPQADEGTCSPESQIGETTVSVGLGGDPFSVKGGKVFITGPYQGAPFGLAIVNPAKAGPFDLENTPAHKPACDCLVVRAKLEIDPLTAAISVTSDNSGPYKIPTSIEGIPLQIKHVNVTINKPGFTFNPTNCNPMAVTGTLYSAEGSNDQLSVPFQVTNCRVLNFEPSFSGATSSKVSRTDGVGVTFKLKYPAGVKQGTQSNIGQFKVELPKQLPARLSTLQKACSGPVFAVNPANCPAASDVGHAVVNTPLLPVPLAGPAYFVSHGGAQFPELILVLTGDNVTIDVHVETFISKAGITSGTIKTVPDAPFSTFELTLPAGPDSEFTGTGNLCKTKLLMPTHITAQDGETLNQSNPITVTGCKAQKVAKHRKAKKARKSKGR